MNNPMDLSEEERKRLQAQLTNVDVGPGGVGASGRMTYDMPVDKNTNLQLSLFLLWKFMLVYAVGNLA